MEIEQYIIIRLLINLFWLREYAEMLTIVCIFSEITWMKKAHLW